MDGANFFAGMDKNASVSGASTKLQTIAANLAATLTVCTKVTTSTVESQVPGLPRLGFAR